MFNAESVDRNHCNQWQAMITHNLQVCVSHITQIKYEIIQSLTSRLLSQADIDPGVGFLLSFR